MGLIAWLQEDHKILRGQVHLLQSALAIGVEGSEAIEQICKDMSTLLRDHSEREQRLIRYYHEVMKIEGIQRSSIEHSDEPLYLYAVHHFFLTPPRYTLAGIRPSIRMLIVQLEKHMEAQEARLFPVLQRAMKTAMPDWVSQDQFCHLTTKEPLAQAGLP
ncbi:MAG: hypothetical protein HYY57_03905 [Candidatus Omnitrophica bacterium]|nr:hypothetical protein [Candidatus Omnitrophota bacterium]